MIGQNAVECPTALHLFVEIQYIIGSDVMYELDVFITVKAGHFFRDRFMWPLETNEQIDVPVPLAQHVHRLPFYGRDHS